MRPDRRPACAPGTGTDGQIWAEAAELPASTDRQEQDQQTTLDTVPETVPERHLPRRTHSETVSKYRILKHGHATPRRALARSVALLAKISGGMRSRRRHMTPEILLIIPPPLLPVFWAGELPDRRSLRTRRCLGHGLACSATTLISPEDNYQYRRHQRWQDHQLEQRLRRPRAVD